MGGGAEGGKQDGDRLDEERTTRRRGGQNPARSGEMVRSGVDRPWRPMAVRTPSYCDPADIPWPSPPRGRKSTRKDHCAGNQRQGIEAIFPRSELRDHGSTGGPRGGGHGRQRQVAAAGTSAGQAFQAHQRQKATDRNAEDRTKLCLNPCCTLQQPETSVVPDTATPRPTPAKIPRPPTTPTLARSDYAAGSSTAARTMITPPTDRRARKSAQPKNQRNEIGMEAGEASTAKPAPSSIGAQRANRAGPGRRVRERTRRAGEIAGQIGGGRDTRPSAGLNPLRRDQCR